MNNTPNLKPCPFCGGMATAKPIDSVPGWYHVTVLHSGCFYKPAMDQMVLNDESLEAWNRRTPQLVNFGFTIENRAGIDVLVWKDGGCRPATTAEVAMWKALSAVQQPVVREPLTDAQIDALIATKHFREGYELTASVKVCINWYRLGLRDGERAHGITQKGGKNE